MFAKQMVVIMTHRQQEIVDHAIELIAEGGVQVLTMKRLASRLGMSEPALYRHFAGKADILLAILDQFESRVMSLIHSLNELQEPEQVLDQFFNNQIRQFSTRPAMASVVFAEELFRNNHQLYCPCKKIL
ncbi:TetR family transcriptional regulator [candidate division KSB1 bacterium]|nr:TetR family transcriptional regulator [candidate division KSB1 bacterium]